MGNSISKPALILFTDIIDSSQYSAILGIEEYAKYILKFQEVFSKVSREYFSDNKDLGDAYIKCASQGDEGAIFIVPDKKQDLNEMIYLAVHYAFDLKARLSINFSEEVSMKKMQIATGIHYGDVATVKGNDVVEVLPNEIEEIVGYNINYAKRIESSSRVGKYSRIFLSKAASSFLSYKPIVLKKHEVDLKGISKLEDVFEVRSAFCNELRIDNLGEEELERFTKKYISGKGLNLIDEPWLKSYIISVLESIRSKEPEGDPLEKKYKTKISDFIWENHAEDDPVVLFVRALFYGNEGKFTRKISILKEITERFPSFVYAKKQLVETISYISNHSDLKSEFVYARDIALELLEKFPQVVADEEKFNGIIAKLNEIIE